MELKRVYKQLTNVEIDEQRQIWDERGKGFYGEYLLFCKLYKEIAGNGKLLMNLNLPVGESRTTEVDLLLIHETGLYVFEIKHYKGVIYGQDTDPIWTQYFRTASNNTFRNPIEQNGYHIRAIKKLFPDMPVRSCIVFTSDECEIRVVNTNEEIDICRLSDVGNVLGKRFQKGHSKYSMKEIDSIFAQLSMYSPMRDTVAIDKAEADFSTWIQPTIAGLEWAKAEVNREKEKLLADKEKLRKTKRKGILCLIASVFLCVLVSAGIVLQIGIGYNLAVKMNNEKVEKNNAELAEFKQKFMHIDEIDNQYIDALNSYVNVTNVSLNCKTDDAVSFTARIAMKNDIYGIALTEGSKYLVKTRDGNVYEYDVFGEHLRYNRIANMIGTGIRTYGDLKEIQFYGIFDLNDIVFIKITGVELFKLEKRTVIKKELEIGLYDCDD